MVPLLWWDFPPFNYSCCFHLKLIKCFRMANRAGLFRKNTQRHPAPARSGTFLFLFKGLRISFFQNDKRMTGFGALQNISRFSHTKERWTLVPWDFLERRIHCPDFNCLLWMEEARRTGKCCSLWKALTVISVPGHLQWRREHLISKVKTLLYHWLGIKDPLPLFSATFWCFSSIFIHAGKNLFQQHCSEATIAQFWQCHNDIVFLPLSLRMLWSITELLCNRVRSAQRGAAVGKVEAFAASALTLLLPSGVLDILDEESPWMIPRYPCSGEV